MTNNQQLAAHCRDVIANPQDHMDWVVDMARVALASLEAEPVAKRDSTQIGGLTMFPFEGAIGHEDGTLYYTAPPVPVMQTVVLPELNEDFYNRYGAFSTAAFADLVKEAIRAAGGSVKE